jgi:hypothetical protein
MLLVGKELIKKTMYFSALTLTGGALLGVAAAGLLVSFFSKDDDKKKEKSSNNYTRDECMGLGRRW